MEPAAGGTHCPFFIVGVGASAGGLEALGKFFTRMPLDSGLAFVVVQHLSPDYKSFMVELLSKRTGIPVHRAEDGLEVKPDNIYLIPPRKHLKLWHGRIQLVEPEHERGINLPIDVFFRSLAEHQKHQAIGVVLSGTGSDGTMGIRAIKEAGGVAMVQSESTAQFDGMPRSAIGTGLADFILAPEDMAGHLMQYVQHPFVAQAQGIVREQSSTETLMHRIFALLHERCGVDFSLYRAATIDRRIERRMGINQIQSLSEYCRYLDSSPREAGLLFNELLICVTRFFRDRESFGVMEKTALPALIQRNAESRSLRAWVAGCSTGEEAYSLAMLLSELTEATGKEWDIKIFATDISKNALEAAGSGLYLESLVADVPAERLKRFFVRKPEGYLLRTSIRKMVVFARHDLLKDPPFTKLDVVFCRNVLIYFEPTVQNKVISLFHFGLKPDGVLFLGSSETVGSLAELFQNLSIRHKVYLRRPGPKAAALPFRLQPVGHRDPVGQPLSAPAARITRGAIDFSTLESVYREILADYAPACVVIDENQDVLHLLGQAADYLRPPAGAFTNNLLKLTSHNLAPALATALHKAAKAGGEFVYDNVRFQSGQSGRKVRSVRLRIKTLNSSLRTGPLRLVFIEQKKDPPPRWGKAENFEIDKSAQHRINELEQEISYTKESLQATIEELETSNEELQATNEELLAANEELQSTNEELQSVNEELHTVNAENQSRIEELAELTNDINNLLTTSHVGTMLVDKSFRIRRASDAVFKLTPLTLADTGAPLEVLARALRFGDLVSLAEKVLAEDRAEEREVAHPSGQHLLVRMAPYKTETAVTRGLVITIIDLTRRRQSEHKLAESERLYRVLSENAGDLVSLHDLEGRILYASPSFGRKLGRRPEALVRVRWLELVHPDDVKVFQQALRDVIGDKEGATVEYRLRDQAGRYLWVESLTTAIRDEGGRVVQLLTTSRDISGRRAAEEALRQSRELATSILNAIPANVAVVDANGRIIAVNEPWLRFARENNGREPSMLGVGADYFAACVTGDPGPGRPGAGLLEDMKAVLAGRLPETVLEYPCHSRDQRRWFRLHARRVEVPQGGLVVSHYPIPEPATAHSSEPAR